MRARRGPIKWRSALRNTIYDVLQSKKEWIETESEQDWDFFWADKGCADKRALRSASSSNRGRAVGARCTLPPLT